MGPMFVGRPAQPIVGVSTSRSCFVWVSHRRQCL